MNTTTCTHCGRVTHAHDMITSTRMRDRRTFVRCVECFDRYIARAQRRSTRAYVRLHTSRIHAMHASRDFVRYTHDASKRALIVALRMYHNDLFAQ